MIADSTGSMLVSSLGWADGGSLWACETAARRVRRLRLGDYEHIRLFAGRDDHFAVQPLQHGGWTPLLAVHRFDAPARAVAELVVDGTHAHFEGDVEAWALVPRAYVARLPDAPALAPFALLVLRTGAGRVDVQLERMSWFADGSYDLTHQAPLAPLEDEDRPLVTIPVQRDSQPVVYDWLDRRVVGTIGLAGRRGNPQLARRPGTDEVWAADYDTLLRLEPRAGVMLGSGGFIGDYAFSADGSSCLVPRPFAGDVALVDPGRFDVTARAITGREPVEAVLVDEEVLARDWRTGDLLAAKLAG